MKERRGGSGIADHLILWFCLLVILGGAYIESLPAVALGLVWFVLRIYKLSLRVSVMQGTEGLGARIASLERRVASLQVSAPPSGSTRALAEEVGELKTIVHSLLKALDAQAPDKRKEAQ